MTGDSVPTTALHDIWRKALMATAIVVAISPAVALGSLHGQRAGLFTANPTEKAAAATALAITTNQNGLSALQKVRVSITDQPLVAKTEPQHHQIAEPVVALNAEPTTPTVIEEPTAEPAIALADIPAAKPEPVAEVAEVTEPAERLVFANRIDNTTGGQKTAVAAVIDTPAVIEVAAISPPNVVVEPSIAAAEPWLRHAVSVDLSSDRPKIAVVIDDLGLSQSRTKATMALPGPLTMAFLPYANNLDSQTKDARDAGHELLVHIPMQPISDSQDPGPKALRTDLTSDEMLRRLRSALASFDGYVGINNHMGSKFTSDTKGMLVVLQELKRRGLMFLDSQTSNNSVAGDLAASLDMPNAKRSVFIDHDQDANSVRRSLNQLEVTARHFGVAVGIGHPHRVTLDALAEWLPGLAERGFDLIPISAVAKLRLDRDRPEQVAARQE